MDLLTKLKLINEHQEKINITQDIEKIRIIYLTAKNDPVDALARTNVYQYTQEAKREGSS